MHPLVVQSGSGFLISHASTVDDVHVHNLTGQVGVLAEEAQLLQEHDEGQNHRGTQKCPQQRTEGVRQNVEDVGEPPGLLTVRLCRSLALSLLRHGGQRVNLVVHGLNTVTQHHLGLAGLLNHGEHAGQGLNLLVLHGLVRHGGHTQAGRAVRHVRDVLGAAEAVENLLAKFAVVHDTSLDMRSKSMHRVKSGRPGGGGKQSRYAQKLPKNTKDPSALNLRSGRMPRTGIAIRRDHRLRAGSYTTAMVLSHSGLACQSSNNPVQERDTPSQ